MTTRLIKLVIVTIGLFLTFSCNSSCKSYTFPSLAITLAQDYVVVLNPLVNNDNTRDRKLFSLAKLEFEEKKQKGFTCDDLLNGTAPAGFIDNFLPTADVTVETQDLKLGTYAFLKANQQECFIRLQISESEENEITEDENLTTVAYKLDFSGGKVDSWTQWDSASTENFNAKSVYSFTDQNGQNFETIFSTKKTKDYKVSIITEIVPDGIESIFYLLENYDEDGVVASQSFDAVRWSTGGRTKADEVVGLLSPGGRSADVFSIQKLPTDTDYTTQTVRSYDDLQIHLDDATIKSGQTSTTVQTSLKDIRDDIKAKAGERFISLDDTFIHFNKEKLMERSL